MKAASAKSCHSCGELYDADVLFCPRDGTPLASSRTPSFSSAERDPYLGLELPGQIQLKHLIGIGSMGRVYRAFQGGIERDVAVKVLHRELSGNAELVRRFHREAKIASRLIHSNVVQVLMTGSMPSSGDPRLGGELYLVMEHLDGISLLSALAAAGTPSEGAALPLPRALHIALQVCDAVGEAHAQGIVHRDLKPENVMLVHRGDDHDYVKVLDFGIARLDWADRDMATQAGLIFGTAKYISPEGAEGQPVGPAADVYSIATILYQMLAGHTPFEGDSPVALLVQHTHAPPPALRSIARSSYVPAPLSTVIMANLAKKPAERASNARLFGRDLVTAARQSGLYPEEIASQSALFSSSKIGAVKLASKERTRALELSADLVARIGGVGAPPGEPNADAARGAEEASLPLGPALSRPATASHPHMNGTVSPSHRDDASASELGGATANGAHAPLAEAGKVARTLIEPELTPIPSAPSSAGRGPRFARTAPPDLDFEGATPEVRLPSASTIQGTETTLAPETPRPPPRRARLSRLVAILACALVAMPIAIVGGRRFGGFGAPGGNDSIEASLDEARDAMRRHAWDAPPGHNFKEITALGMARWPDTSKFVDLRREAAERIVYDALGRKYAGDLPEAIRLVRLALDWNPQLTIAQHLAADLEVGHSPDVAPVSPNPSASATDRGGNKGPRKGPGATGAPGGGAGRKPAEPRLLPPVPTQSSAGAVLPPSPPPLPSDHTPPPNPSSTGPWL